MVDREEGIISFIGTLVVQLQIESGVDQDLAKQQRDDFIFKISSAYGGQRLYINTAQKIRKTRIIDGWKRGRTVSQLALDFDLTQRQIYNVIASL